MIAKCANPGCNVAFRYLRKGKLFMLDIPRSLRNEGMKATASQRRLEYFWLCDQCSVTMRIVINESGEATISGLVGAQPNLAIRPAV